MNAFLAAGFMKGIEILDFDEENATEILEIQAESGLSVWTKSDYSNEAGKPDSIFKIARTNENRIAGFALVRLLGGDPNTANTFFNSSEILNIAVRRSFRQKKIGQMIFDEVLSALRQKNVGEIWLEVRASNEQAINFYRKNGFEKQAERKNYYTEPIENALIFRRLIES